jgi:hypothetical protein
VLEHIFPLSAGNPKLCARGRPQGQRCRSQVQPPTAGRLWERESALRDERLGRPNGYRDGRRPYPSRAGTADSMSAGRTGSKPVFRLRMRNRWSTKSARIRNGGRWARKKFQSLRAGRGFSGRIDGRAPGGNKLRHRVVARFFRLLSCLSRAANSLQSSRDFDADCCCYS